MPTPEEYGAERLAARAAKYRTQVARLRELTTTPPTYLDARRNLGRGAEDETTETEGSAEA